MNHNYLEHKVNLIWHIGHDLETLHLNLLQYKITINLIMSFWYITLSLHSYK